MGLDTQVYIREIENLPHESAEFETGSVAPVLLLTVAVICGYALSLLMGPVIR